MSVQTTTAVRRISNLVFVRTDWDRVMKLEGSNDIGAPSLLAVWLIHIPGLL